MKIKLMLFSVSLGLAATFSSCTNDDVIATTSHTGLLNLGVVNNASFATTATRVVNEEVYKNVDSYTVEITDGAGNSKFTGTYSDLKTQLPMTLSLGSYNIKAYFGSENVVSRDEIYVVGEETVTIKADEELDAVVTCEPTCGKISAVFSNDMSTYFSDYSIAFYGTSALGATDANAVVWTKTDTAPYYLKLNNSSDGETVSFKLNVLTNDGFYTGENNNRQQAGLVTGSFNLKRNEAHKLTIGPNFIEDSTGNLSITIKIDEGTNDIPVEIVVPITWIEK